MSVKEKFFAWLGYERRVEFTLAAKLDLREPDASNYESLKTPILAFLGDCDLRVGELAFFCMLSLLERIALTLLESVMEEAIDYMSSALLTLLGDLRLAVTPTGVAIKSMLLL